MNFRKHISLFLAFFLLVSNTELAFNVHFCEDTIASITVFSNSNSIEIEENCCGIVEEKSDCCNNKIIKSDKKLDQVLLKSFSFEILNTVLPTTCKLIETASILNFKRENFPQYNCNSNAPPIFERNCQRIFYA